MDFTVYDEITGEILRGGNAPPNMIAIQAGVGEKVIPENSNDLTQYVHNGMKEVLNKAANSATIDKTEMNADEVDFVRISSLPIPSVVIIEDERYVVTSGFFEFSVDEPGEYTIFCKNLYYLDKEFIINAS